MILSPIFRKRQYSEGLKFIIVKFIVWLPLTITTNNSILDGTRLLDSYAS